MYHQKKQLAVLAVLSVVTSAFDLPDNLRAIYQQNLVIPSPHPALLLMELIGIAEQVVHESIVIYLLGG